MYGMTHSQTSLDCISIFRIDIFDSQSLVPSLLWVWALFGQNVGQVDFFFLLVGSQDIYCLPTIWAWLKNEWNILEDPNISKSDYRWRKNVYGLKKMRLIRKQKQPLVHLATILQYACKLKHTVHSEIVEVYGVPVKGEEASSMDNVF